MKRNSLVKAVCVVLCMLMLIPTQTTGVEAASSKPKATTYYYMDDGDTHFNYCAINSKGKVIVEAGKYDYISDFSGGYADVYIDNKKNKFAAGKCGIIDTKGNLVVKMGKYDSIGVSNGYAVVSKGGKYGVIKISTGKYTVKLGKYSYIGGDASDGYAVVSTGDNYDSGKVGIIKLSNGKEVVKLGKYDIIEGIKDGYAFVGKNDKYGLIKISTGKEVVKLGKYDGVKDISGDYAVVTKNNESGVIKLSTGKVLIKIGKYDKLIHVYDNYAVVYKNYVGYGVIDLTTGKFVIKLGEFGVYTSISGIYNGYALAGVDRDAPENRCRTAIVDITTKEFLVDYDEYRQIGWFINGFALATTWDGDHVILNTKFEITDTF